MNRRDSDHRPRGTGALVIKDEDSDATAAKLEAVLGICQRPGRILVLMQDNPDPDALASAAALRDLVYLRLKKRLTIGYGGTCGRAENRAMMAVLRIDARRLTLAQLPRYKTICLVDAQPNAGNNILVPSRPPEIVIDHHLLPKKRTWIAEFADVRPGYGATSTILYEYLLAGGVKLSANLATALFYGIQSDTQDLGREAGLADVRAYRDLFLLADKKKLAHIHRAPVPADYFKMLGAGIDHCVVAGSTVISYIPACHNVDMIAEVADFLIRLEGMRTAVCYAVYEDKIHLSARAVDARGNVARRMKQVVSRLGTGGGHRAMAGGQVAIEGDVERRLAFVHARILKSFAPNKEPVPLTPPFADTY